MSRSFRYEYNGIKGLSALSEAYGVPIRTITARLKKNHTLEEALSMTDQRTKKALVWNGIKGAKAIAESLGVCEATLHNHLRQKGSIEMAVETIQLNKKSGHKKTHKAKEQVGIKAPTAMNSKWKIALGMQA